MINLKNMARILEIIKNPNPKLRIKAVDFDIAKIRSKETKSLIKNMIKTMHKGDGIGLAGTQVGEERRIFVIGKETLKNQSEETRKILGVRDSALFNAVFLPQTGEKEWDMEGCLSVPEIFGEVERFKKIRVRAINETGKKIDFIAENFFARVLQHEIDHLNGVLFIDKARNIISETQAQKNKS